MNKSNIESLKAYKKASRELDIQLHGKPIAFRPLVTVNKKKYNRKKQEKFFFDS